MEEWEKSVDLLKTNSTKRQTATQALRTARRILNWMRFMMGSGI